MNLTPIGNPAHETIRGVRFAMLGGFELVTVLVTHAALDEIEAQRPENVGYLDRFDRYRDRFEQRARTQRLFVVVARAIKDGVGNKKSVSADPFCYPSMSGYRHRTPLSASPHFAS
jgi:hypothetical protein